MRLRQLASVIPIAYMVVATPGVAGGSSGCVLDKAGESAQAGAVQEYTADELKVIGYIADRLVTGEPPSFTSEEIQAATGVTLEAIEGLSRLRIEQGLIAEMTRRGIDVAAFAGNCAKFSACSIDRDLSGASGEDLARYEEEKAQDGRPFEAWTAPDFTLPRTTGGTAALADYKGRSVALVFLSGHCNHSMETLPVLDQLAEEYEGKEIAILPVYVNSGSVEDIKTWSSSLGVDMPLLVDEGKALSEAYGFRMVPTTFLIDREGRVARKLVGQKDRDTLARAFSDLIGTKVATSVDR